MKEAKEKRAYQKPRVIAATKNKRNFSASCMGGLCECLHCRKY